MTGCGPLFSVAGKWFSRCFCAPTLTKGVVCSVFIHSAAIASVILWNPGQTDRLTFSGQHDAVYIDLSLSIPQTAVQPKETDEAELQPPTQVAIAHSVPQNKPPTELEAPPQQAPAKCNDLLLTELEPIELVIPPNDLLPKIANSKTTPSHRTHETENVQVKLTEIAHRLQRRVPKVSIPPSQKAIKQIAGVDDKTPIEFTYRPTPPYPKEAVRFRLEGTVMLQIHIASDGSLTVSIENTSGHEILDQAAVNTVQDWKIRPTYLNGKPVESTETMPVRFYF